MQQRLPTRVPTLTVPHFYITGRQRLRPEAILLAFVAAAGALSLVLYLLSHTTRSHLGFSNGDAARSAGAASGAAPPADDKDDPSQVDTIVLGDPADAPVPARRGDHVSPVHPFVVVHLPRFGDEVGLIPNSPAGQLLYAWLAAFNQASYAELANVLPNAASDAAADAQMELRQQTGGFSLLSAREIAPGILVFRLRDQTPLAGEVLGTLKMRANSSPATIETFSLRAVPSPGQKATQGAEPASVAPPR